MTDERLPIEPDRRYLRRGGNRRVRKARRLRGLLRFWRVAAGHLLVTTLVVFACVHTARRLAASPELTLEKIEVAGAHRTTPKAIRSRLSPFVGRNLAELDLDDVTTTVLRDPWVGEASVKRMLPRTLRVEITERTPAALALIRGLAHAVDPTGHVIGPCGPGLAEDLPVLTGLDGLDGEALVAALARGVAAIGRLREVASEFAAEVSELDLSQPNRYRAVTLLPGPVILLDPERVERNVNTYLAMRAEVEQRVGPIEYVDLRWRHLISVLPATEDSSSWSE